MTILLSEVTQLLGPPAEQPQAWPVPQWLTLARSKDPTMALWSFCGAISSSQARDLRQLPLEGSVGSLSLPEPQVPRLGNGEQ
jgi:hypothetical protein